MAEVTLQNVIERMKEEGQLTRTGPDSLKVAIGELKVIRSDFTKLFEFFKEYTISLSNKEALQDPSKDTTSNKSVSDNLQPEKKDITPKSGFLGGVLGGLGIGGIITSISSGLSAAFKTLFSPGALLRVLARVATKFGPVAIVTGIIAAISGGITSFFESEKTTFLGRLGEGFSGAIGQVIEFFTFGLVKKEKVMELLKPLTDLFEDIGIWVLDMIDGPGKAVDTAVAAMTRVGIWFSGVLGNLWESLGLDDLTKTLFGTKVTGEQVTKFITNLFSSKPEEGYFSIVKSVSDIWSSVKTWFETKYNGLIELLNTSWTGIVGEGGILDMIWSPFKSALEWLEKKFNSVIELLNTSWTGIVGEGGILDMIWSPFKSALEWLEKKFVSVKDTLITEWDAATKLLTDNFDKVVKWISNIPDRILFAAEEMWIETITDLKKNFLKLTAYLASLPDQILLGAQQAILDNFGGTAIGRGALARMGITQESIDAQKSAMKNDETETSNILNKLDLEKAAQLADLEKRRQATLGTIEDGSTSKNNNAPATAADGNTVIAPTTVGPTYAGPVYNGPVTITYDNATTWGLDPNKMRGNFAYGDF